MGVSFSRDLYWKDHIISLASQASKRLGVLRRLKKFFTPSQFFALYRGLVRPCMEYASHVWGRSPRAHLDYLDAIQSRAVRLIDSPEITSSLQPLHDRRNVASLSLFYRYYNGRCSSELDRCLPPPLRRVGGTRQSALSHAYSVELHNPRLNRRRDSFFVYVSSLWNNLPSSVFPSTYSLDSFKRGVARLGRLN